MRADRTGCLRRLGRGLGLLGLVVALLFVAKRLGDALVIRSLRQVATPGPVRFTEQESAAYDGFRIELFRIEDDSGTSIPVTAMVPTAMPGPHPAVIVLYGIGMKAGMRLELSDDMREGLGPFLQAGFAIVIPEQYGRGVRRDPAARGLRRILALRRRVALTIHEARRVMDALEQCPEIDADRVYLWGISFGAITGIPTVAYDPRFRGAVLTAGAGNLPLMVADTAYLRDKPFFSAERWALYALASILRPFDPIRHVGFIAPRPLLFQNTPNDELLPKSAVESLYAAAGEPKTIRWLESPHNRPDRKVIAQLLREGLAWLQAREAEN